MADFLQSIESLQIQDVHIRIHLYKGSTYVLTHPSISILVLVQSWIPVNTRSVIMDVSVSVDAGRYVKVKERKPHHTSNYCI